MLDVLHVSARWLVLIALAMLASAPAFALFVMRREATRALYRATAVGRARWIHTAAALALIAFLLDALVHARWTWFGARAALLAGAWASLSQERVSIGAVLVATLLLTQSFQGNPAQQAEWVLPVLADWVHLLSATVWLGGVGYLVTVVLPGALREEALLAGLAETVRAFSSLAVAAVLAASITGIAQSAGLVGSLEALLSTAYGQALLVKLSGSAVLLVLGAFHQLVISPQLSLWRLRAQQALDAARRFRISLALESAFAVFTLAAAAAMTLLPAPSLHAAP